MIQCKLVQLGPPEKSYLVGGSHARSVDISYIVAVATRSSYLVGAGVIITSTAILTTQSIARICKNQENCIAVCAPTLLGSIGDDTQVLIRDANLPKETADLDGSEISLLYTRGRLPFTLFVRAINLPNEMPEVETNVIISSWDVSISQRHIRFIEKI